MELKKQRSISLALLKVEHIYWMLPLLPSQLRSPSLRKKTNLSEMELLGPLFLEVQKEGEKVRPYLKLLLNFSILKKANLRPQVTMVLTKKKFNQRWICSLSQVLWSQKELRSQKKPELRYDSLNLVTAINKAKLDEESIFEGRERVIGSAAQ